MENDMYLVLPDDIYDLDELDRWRDKWNMLSYDMKQRSNDMSIEKYGQTNLYRYNQKKAEYFKYNDDYEDDEHDIDTIASNKAVYENAINTSFADIVHVESDTQRVDIEHKIKVAQSDGHIIMVLDKDIWLDSFIPPYIDILEDKWNKFNALSQDSKDQSNGIALSILGMDNYNLYTTLKNIMISKMEDKAQISDRDIETYDSMRKSLNGVCEFHNLMNKYAQSIDESFDHEEFESFKRISSKNEKRFDYMDNMLPFFTPDEMEHFGVFSGEINMYSPTPDNLVCGLKSTEEWFNEYKQLRGRWNPSQNYVWEKTLINLYRDYDKILESGDEQKILNRKQSILELGWNPEIGFSHEAAVKVRYRRLEEDSAVLEYEDLSDFYHNYTDDEDFVTEDTDSANQKLKEIFIIFVGIGNKFRSKIIRGWTHSDWSHSAISLDPSLQKVYSYSRQYDEKTGKDFSGFNLENIPIWLNTDPNSNIAVHSVFVSQAQYTAIKNALDWYMEHKYETKYDIANIIRIVFQKVSDPLERLKMICSQFVYSLLNLVNIKLPNNKANNLVTPEDLYNLKNPRIYRLYKGRVDNYKKNIITKMLRDIKKDPEKINIARKYTFNTIVEAFINGCTIAEFKSLLHEYSTNNDILKSILEVLSVSYTDRPLSILSERVRGADSDNEKFIIKTIDDVNTEYFKCHRNLVSYEKAGNYESMKDELCKLKYLDNFAVKKMAKKDKHYKEYADAHARITNDFNKYLKIVTEHDPNFNFSEYYKNSEWYDGEIRISKKLIEDLLKIIDILLKKFPIGR